MGNLITSIQGSTPLDSTNNDRKSVSFKVDNVEVAAVPTTLRTSADVRKRFCQGGGFRSTSTEVIEASGTNERDPRKWVMSGAHGFFAGVFTAFADHYPLTIKPDHIFQLILEGWSRHVDKHAEELRTAFVFHKGKKIIRVRRDEFIKGNPNNDWPGAFAEFCTQIKENTTPDLYGLVSGDPFTTTGGVEQVARNISLMSLTKHYFDFRLSTCCGFPKITLEGSLDDWIMLRKKVSNLGKYMTKPFADKWIPALWSILDQFLDAYKGKVDKLFWSSMVKYYSTHGSGGDTYITGWINILFPYLNKYENPLIMTWPELKKHVKASGGSHKMQGSSISDFSPFFCTAPVVWEYYTEEFKLQFKTGFIGSTQNLNTGEISPQLSWAIIEEKETSKTGTNTSLHWL